MPPKPLLQQDACVTRIRARMQQLGYGVAAIRKVLSAVTARASKEEGAACFKHVTVQEEELMRHMHGEGFGVKKIASAIGRSTDTVSKHVFKKHLKKAPKGRPVAIGPATYKKVESVYQKMLRECKGQEVTVTMVKQRMKLKCSVKSLSRAFWQHGVYFRPLYEKPDLSREDIRHRCEWAAKHAHRSAAQWGRYVHAIIDNKTFQVFHTPKARGHAARRRVRGAYRTKRRIFTAGYTKPAATLKHNTGAKSVTVTCAIGNGKVLMWHVVDGRWNGEAAAKMYNGPLKRCLAKEYPHVRGPWRVMEDNDPSGYKSSKGMAGKREAGIITLDLPKRSPDLNPLDFSLWAAINRKMRQKERGWPANKRETRKSYIARLRRTAYAMPKDYVDKIIGAMAGRVQQVLDFSGGFFPEGGL